MGFRQATLEGPCQQERVTQNTVEYTPTASEEALFLSLIAGQVVNVIQQCSAAGEFDGLETYNTWCTIAHHVRGKAMQLHKRLNEERKDTSSTAD